MFKDIPEYQDYEVSSSGFVRNKRTGRVLRFDKTNRGYYRVTVCKGNKTKRWSIHRLVALLFIQNPNNHETVNHKDGDKSNNDVSNLEWMSQEENQEHAVSSGLCPRGSSQTGSKFTESQVRFACQLIQFGAVRSVVLNATGLTISAFDDIRRRKSWVFISNDYYW